MTGFLIIGERIMSRFNKRCDWCNKYVDVNNSLGMLLVAGNKLYCSKKCRCEAEAHENGQAPASGSGCLIMMLPFAGIIAGLACLVF